MIWFAISDVRGVAFGMALDGFQRGKWRRVRLVIWVKVSLKSL
jgi:hypothetical protein